eukprot:c10322_g1_i1 orf=202-1692(-)
MGSVCCTAGRARDMAEASDGWSMEQTGHVNQGTSHVTLSPPPVSSRWERKSHFSEIAAGRNCMSLRRTPSSSSRSYRSNSNSNSISSESRATSSHRLCETADGLLAIFNSPSESFRYSQRSFDHVPDSVAIPSELVFRRSAAFSNQVESGLSTSSVVLGSASQKALEGSDCVRKNKQSQHVAKLGLSASKSCKRTRQGIEPSFSFEGVSMDKMTSVGLDPYQQMMRNSVDVPLSYSRQKSGSWKISGFSDLVESSHPGSSRWSSMGISNIFADGDHQEDVNDLYIRSTGAMHHHDLGAARQVEIHECGLCGKAISLSNFSRVLGSKDLPVVGVLDCGHVYHAECLDQATPLTQAHDPPCPKCEDQVKAQIRVQGESYDKTKSIGIKEPMKGKLFRVGVFSTDDAESSKSYQPVWNHCGLSENSSRKGASYNSAHTAERSFSTKSLLRKQFSFRGKLSREATNSNFGSKRPGYPARVSPENSTREDDHIVMGEKRIN